MHKKQAETTAAMIARMVHLSKDLHDRIEDLLVPMFKSACEEYHQKQMAARAKHEKGLLPYQTAEKAAWVLGMDGNGGQWVPVSEEQAG